MNSPTSWILITSMNIAYGINKVTLCWKILQPVGSLVTGKGVKTGYQRSFHQMLCLFKQWVIAHLFVWNSIRECFFFSKEKLKCKILQSLNVILWERFRESETMSVVKARKQGQGVTMLWQICVLCMSEECQQQKRHWDLLTIWSHFDIRLLRGSEQPGWVFDSQTTRLHSFS